MYYLNWRFSLTTIFYFKNLTFLLCVEKLFLNLVDEKSQNIVQMHITEPPVLLHIQNLSGVVRYMVAASLDVIFFRNLNTSSVVETLAPYREVITCKTIY